MAYTIGFDPASKKELKEAVASGRKIGVKHGLFHGQVADNGTFGIEGPQYPKPHRFYASVVVKDGAIVSVK